jgi:hypothetical protein
LLPPGSAGPRLDIHRPVAGPRPPVNVCVLDALREVPVALTGWANVCLQARGREELTTAGKRWGYLLSQALGVLAAEDDVLAYQDVGAHYLVALYGLKRRMTLLTGRDALVHVLSAPCPACHTKRLYRHDGTDTVLCGACGQSWSGGEYDRYIWGLLRNASAC